MKIKCLLCNSSLDAFHVFPKKAIFNKPLRKPIPDAVVSMGLAYCPSCRHISSAFEEDVLRENLTKQIYGEIYEGYVPTNLSKRQLDFTLFVSELLQQFLPAKSRVLEIGCHDGFFLSLLRDKDFKCEGVEPSPFADIAASKYGLNVKKDFFRKGIVDENVYDAVILRHVIEHVTSPVSFLNDVLGVLKKGGVAYIEAPDSLGSLEAKFYPEFHIDHISYFTQASLRQLLRFCNFTELIHHESFKAYMQFPFQAVLARKDHDQISQQKVNHAWFIDFNMPKLISEFTERFNKKYLPRIKNLHKGRKLAVWGTGSIGHQYAIEAQWGLDDAIYIDPNPVNQGKFLSVTGHKVFSPGAINERGCDTILIASGWEDDVREQISATVDHDVDIVSFADFIK